MLCKKCGAEISDASKFCGYCGISLVEVPVNENNLSSENNVETVANTESIVDLGNTVRIEPIEEVSNNNLLENLGSNSLNENNQMINNQPQIKNNDGVVSNQMQTNQNNKKSSNKKLMFIAGGVLLTIVAVVVVLLAFMKSSNNSVVVLEKALNNLVQNSDNSSTLDAKVSFASTTGESFAFTATIKSEMKENNNIDMLITINKSLFFEEMNIYASINEDELTAYLYSSLIDMLGMTSSLEPTWVHYIIPLDELLQEGATQSNTYEFDLADIVDKKHFVYVGEGNELKHYQLIIDQDLINNIKTKLENTNEEEIKEMFDSMETLEESIKLDLYINSLNQLTKIELDMTEYLEDSEDISSLILSFEFSNLNSTKVEIPNNVKNSTIDLDTYMMQNQVNIDTEIDYNENYEYNYYYDGTFDSNFSEGT